MLYLRWLRDRDSGGISMKFNLLAWGTVLFMQVQSGLPASSISPGETQRELPPAGLTQDPDNPLASARPGDEVSYSQKVRMGTETEQSRFHIKVLSVKKDLVSYQVTTTHPMKRIDIP